MLPDEDTCFAAMTARDGRFDGRFFVGVLSTGIYCRPVCPARTPLRRNVRFFATAAAASAAGLRACRRCRPDSLPGSRQWDAGHDLAARALRLIGAGVVDGEGVAGLAQRLHISERHVRRVVQQHAGASPLDLARTRRAQTARLLVEQTDLSLADIAFAAGFASVRQFNDVMVREFGAPPSGFRRVGVPAARTPDVGSEGTSSVTLRLACRSPYDTAQMLDWCRRHALPGVDRAGVEHGRDWFATALPNGDQVRVTWLDDVIVARVEVTGLASLLHHVRAIRGWLDLDAQPEAIAEVLARQPFLASLVAARPGIRVPTCLDPFRASVMAVLAQQVSVAAAGRLGARLVQAAGADGRFPRPETLGTWDPDRLAVALGMPKQRAVAVLAVARAVADGGLDLSGGADPQDVEDRLLALPGVGPWTAAEVRLRALRDPDVWPPGDLVLRRTVATATPTPFDQEPLRPWRSYAAHQVWAHASAPPPSPSPPAPTPPAPS